MSIFARIFGRKQSETSVEPVPPVTSASLTRAEFDAHFAYLDGPIPDGLPFIPVEVSVGEKFTFDGREEYDIARICADFNKDPRGFAYKRMEIDLALSTSSHHDSPFTGRDIKLSLERLVQPILMIQYSDLSLRTVDGFLRLERLRSNYGKRKTIAVIVQWPKTNSYLRKIKNRS